MSEQLVATESRNLTFSDKRSSVADKAIVPRHAVDKQLASRVAVILQAHVKDRNGERAGGSVAGCVSGRAAHCRRAYRYD